LRINLFVLGIAVIAAAGCSGGTDPNAVPVIGTANEYLTTLQDAENTSKDLLEKINRDEPLTLEDKTRLSKAASQFESLQAYEPGKPGPYIALGIIYRGLEQREIAERALNLCLQHLGGNTSPEFMQTAAEVHYQLSRVKFDSQKYDYALAEASSAIQSVPDNPAYLTARGAAYLQLKRYAEARKDLKAALKLDPNYTRASGLLKLLH